MKTHKIPALAMRAETGTVDAEKRTVEVVWTTGARVMRGYYDRFWEELSLDPKHVRMGRLNAGAPFLQDHNGYRVSETLGVVESATLEKGKGTAVIRFAKAEDDPEADKVFRKIQDGIIRNVSVGYRIHKLEKVEDGDDKIPVYRATDWEPMEISAVAIGADAGAGFRSEHVEMNECEIFTTRGDAPNTEVTMTEEQKRAAEAEAKRIAEETRQAEIKAAVDAGVKAETERREGIQKAVRIAKLGEETAADMIARKLDLNAARAEIFDKLATQSDAVRTDQHVKIEVGEETSQKQARGMTAALVSKSGHRGLIERGVKTGKVGAIDMDGGEFRGRSMAELARLFLEARGVSTRGMDSERVFQAAWNHGRSYAGTSDFAVLFENVMHKVLMSAYATQGDTWSRFCGTKQVSDFRAHNFFRTGSFGALDDLNENGEYKNKPIPDGEKSTLSIGTKGNIIGLSRQAVINDDMSALADLAQKLGRAARLSIEVEVYTALLLNSGLGPTQSDSQPFFHANRTNVNTSATANTAAGWDADRVVMAQQRDISSNEFLDLRPSVLLVPLAKGTEARVLNASQYEPTDNKFQKPNSASGMAKDIIDSPRLSGTRRYWFADPGQNPAILVGFLEGQGEGPVLESSEGWRTDGTELKVRMDFGVKFFDPKCAVTNAGA